MTHHLRMEAEYLELRTRHPFIIARGGQSEYRTVLVRLTDEDGIEGWGSGRETGRTGGGSVTVGSSSTGFEGVAVTSRAGPKIITFRSSGKLSTARRIALPRL